MAKTCKDINDLVPSSASGIYWFEVDGEKLDVRCEMNQVIDFGGWTSGGWIVSLCFLRTHQTRRLLRCCKSTETYIFFAKNAFVSIL